MTGRVRQRLAGGAVVPLLAASMLVGCGSDEAPEGTAPSVSTPTPTAMATTTSSTPSTSAAPRPTTTNTPSARPTTQAPSAAPTDDENGELAGQVIIEYPGKPLRRTAVTTPNSDVRDLQVRLNEVGFPVKVTGVFNAETERVVIRFQRENGLKADGIVGPATWAALFTFEGGEG
jgi:peptidoglycan hydrolase-like protein with peptidoglycan-binding domain